MSDDRNPLNAKALTESELTEGRKIVRFNIRRGMSGVYRVAGPPRNGWIALLLIGAKKPTEHWLADLGVVPYRGVSWNETNFCVDAKDVSGLPMKSEQLSELEEILAQDDLY